MQIPEFQVLKTGLAYENREEIAKVLSHILANTYTLYLNTHNFHWNVTGHMFQPLHELFEEQYTELAEAVDVLAERIRALGFYAPANYSKFIELSEIKEHVEVPTAKEMISSLLQGNEHIATICREGFNTVQENKDPATEDLLIERILTHEKTAWMLRSFLQD